MDDVPNQLQLRVAQDLLVGSPLLGLEFLGFELCLLREQVARVFFGLAIEQSSQKMKRLKGMSCN